MADEHKSAADLQTALGDSENASSSHDALDNALSELAGLIKPLANDLQTLRSFYYLLLMWASFHIYQIEPFPKPYADEENQSPVIIPLSNGWQIVDYGYMLSASPGANYGTYCTGKLIETAREMVRMLASRDVTKVGFSGHEIAKRVAWMEAVEYQIVVQNYQPDINEINILQRVRNLKNKYLAEQAKDALDRRPE